VCVCVCVCVCVTQGALALASVKYAQCMCVEHRFAYEIILKAHAALKAEESLVDIQIPQVSAISAM